ncbi:CoA transferase, partial [Micromonospora vinacea]|uniref:CoA transferase n=1 Tax=Micromonospora vinacea TaxID=709878 RepID=UPI00344DCE2D
MTAPLDGVKVVDLATLFAGPLAAAWRGGIGAQVLNVEETAKPAPAPGARPAPPPGPPRPPPPP